MPEKIQFFVLDAKYKVNDEKPEIYLFGKTNKGNHIILIDDSFEPYFYVIPKKGNIINDKIEKLKVENKDEISQVTKTENVKKVYFEKEVDAIKVFTKLPRDVPAISSIIKEWDIVESVNEYDIQFIRRYFIDKGITPMTFLEAEVEVLTRKARVPVFHIESIKPLGDESLTEPSILAFDIETYNPQGKSINFEKNPILMISFYGKNYRKVITWKRFKTNEKYIEFVDSESDLIQKFKEIIEHTDPDILAGYYSDGFDLPYIQKRAEKYKIKLDVGLDHSDIEISKKEKPKAKMSGIIHLDVFKVITKMFSQTLDTDYYDLSSVSEEMIGEKKLEVDLEELSVVWDKHPGDLEKYCGYNLHDSKLAYGLAEKIMPNLIEMVKIVGLPMFDIARMGFSQLVEWYLIKQARLFNEICPNKPSYGEVKDRMLNTYKGAFVFEPKPGLYKNVTIFDFRSLYPSIISSHNISPGSLNCRCCEGKAEKAPLEKEECWFCKKKKGFLPTVIEDIVERRMRIKEIIKKSSKNILLDARQNNLKVLANAFYGYFGFFNARWYCIECSRSITAWGRYYIHKVIDAAEKEGFKVLYSDSLPYDRDLFVRFNDGKIRLIKIGELYDKYRFTKGLSTISFVDKKVVFKRIKRVIRHEYKRKDEGLLKINTKYGSTIVTPQHSVYSYEDRIKLVDANKLKKGDKLISLTNINIEEKYFQGYVFDLVDMDFGEYQKDLILYSDNLFFQAKRGICPYCNKEVYLSAHVFAKHPERRQKFDKKSIFSLIGTKNAKSGKISRYWVLDNDLAWLLGFYSAEGSVSDIISKKGRKFVLSFGSQDKKKIERVKHVLESKTGRSSNIIKDYDHRISKYMFYYRVQCMPVVALFQYAFGCGKGSEFKKVPWFVFSAEESIRRHFVKGYLDGDGNSSVDKRYKTHFMRFSTKSKELAEGLCFMLKTLKHKSNVWDHKVEHVAWYYRKDKPKINGLRLQSAKESKENFCLAEIRSIEKIPGKDHVYDIEVEGSHNFADAEGMILVHNTDSIFLHLHKKTKEDARQFAEMINRKLPGIMELDYEGDYPAALFVSLKTNDAGAKKKYALLDGHDKIHIKGFETVRRNSSKIAKEVQEKVLTIVLKENDPKKAFKYVESVVSDLLDKKVPIEKVIIHTQLQKEIGSYAAIGPHVVIAKILKEKGYDVGPGTPIEFVVTEGKGKIGDRVKLPEDVKNNNYDPDYYINNQVIPSVEKIFEVIGYKKEDFVVKKGQSKLGSFI
jgi:DNA polymerase elongation subunit (family B)